MTKASRSEITSWAEYVQNIIGDDSQAQAAAKAGLNQATVNRWVHGLRHTRSTEAVTKLAHAYQRPVLEAFVQAGLISPSDAKVRVVLVEVGKLTTDELISELQRRTKSAAS